MSSEHQQSSYEKYGCPACVNGNAGDRHDPECPKFNSPKPESNLAGQHLPNCADHGNCRCESEMRETEGARSLLEIGFDLGVEAAKAARDANLRGEAWSVVNPFRRASTVITQIERVEADAAANARAHLPECSCHGDAKGCAANCDLSVCGCARAKAAWSQTHKSQP